jgi:N4-gp56 family major capsid protein
MSTTLDAGTLLYGGLPQAQRMYYRSVLLDVLRAETIFAGLAAVKEDFAAANTKVMTFSRAFDLHPAIGTLPEAVPFVEGAYLDSAQKVFSINEHGNTIKTNSLQTITSFWDPSFESIVREKLARNMVESVEILARNALLTSGNLHLPAGVAQRGDISSTDIYSPDYGDLSRTALQSRNAVGLNGGVTPLAVIHPRVSRDIRKAAGSDWVEVKKYADPASVVRGEVGMFDGVRYILNNFARLPNAGEIVVQSTLSAPTVKGQGGPDSDEKSPPLLTYVPVTSTTGFVAGMEVSIHKASLGTMVLETDEEAEHRVIATVESGKLYFTEPLLVAHAAGAYVTEARDLYAAVMVGGPGLAMGVAMYPELRLPPIVDDFMRIQRLSWYGIFDFFLIEDAYTEVWVTAASTANHGNV